jgi:hypothetical protein
MTDAEALRLYGTTEPAAAPRLLRAGALHCEFGGSALHRIWWGEIEVLRSIAYLLRDRDWGTVPAVVSGLDVVEGATRFRLRFALRFESAGGDLGVQVTVDGHAEGRLVIQARATATADLPTNRCGFVVLHPAECAGRRLDVEHTDGRRSATTFPRLVSPGQPVFDIRELAYDAGAGVSVQCRLEAELPGDPAGRFEMEDQRNWSDASFKTYVGSLLDPWPYVLPAGRAWVQRVELTMHGAAPQRPATGAAEIEIRLAPGEGDTLPAIGVGVPAGLHRASDPERRALRELGAQWWIAEAALDDPALDADLAALAHLRQGRPARVQLDAIVPAEWAPEHAGSRVAAHCSAAGLHIDAVRLLPAPYLKSYQPTGTWPDLPPLEQYAAAARRHFPHAAIGGGMYTYFTELNRLRPPEDGLDFIGHATSPIVHAPDDRAVMETLTALPHIAATVRSLWPALRYRLGPSTLAMARNPYGDVPAPNPARRRLALAGTDPRHAAQFGAAWTLGYAAATAGAPLDVLALHHSHGASGPLAADGASTHAAWQVLKALAAAAGQPRLAVHGAPAGVALVAWRDAAAAACGLVANLGERPCVVRLRSERLATHIALGPLAVESFSLD